MSVDERPAEPARVWPGRWPGAIAALMACAAVVGQLRVINYNVAQLMGDPGELEIVIRSLTEDPSPVTGVIRAPDVMVFQEVTGLTVDSLMTRLNRNAPTGVTYSLATFTENGGGSDQALAYRAETVIEDPSGHRDILNHTGPRATDRWKLGLAADPDATVFYVYGSHFKANNEPRDQEARASEARAVRADADSLGEGAHVIYAGDWNIYSPYEEAFLVFFEEGPGQAVDPSGHQNSFPAISHTQSPHDGSNRDLVTGGMDDRFDFQLSTEEFNDGEGLSVEAGSYRTFANDGLHFDRAINSGFNAYFSEIEQYKADAAARASDHLPVIVGYANPTNPFRLQVDFLVAGLPSELEVFGAEATRPVYFIYSLRGLGRTDVPQLGVTLRLDAPVLGGQARPNGVGEARLVVTPPLGAQGLDVWVQAAQFGAVTDVVYRIVE